MRLFVDANVFVLALLSRLERGDRARVLLDEISRGTHEVVTSALVLDEVLWALMKAGKGGEQLELPVRNIYEMPNLAVLGVSSDLPLRALSWMGKYRLKPRDAVHCAFMESEGLSLVASDDADFDRVKEFKRLKL